MQKNGTVKGSGASRRREEERETDPLRMVLSAEVVQAEESLIGAMFRDADAQDAICAELGDADPFNVAAHSLMWAAIRKVRKESGEPANGLQVGATIEASGQSKAVGEKKIGELWDRAWDASSWPFYLKIVVEFWKRSEIKLAAMEAAHRIKEGITADDVADELVEVIARLRARGATAIHADKAHRGAELLNALEKRETRVIPTGIGALDDEFGGLPDGGVTTIFGAPGSGKSSLAASLVYRMAKSGRRSAVFSYEMNAETLMAHLVATEAMVDVEATRMRGRPMNDEDYRRCVAAVGAVVETPIEFIDRSVTAPELERLCIALVGRGFKAIVIDYIQNVHTDGDENEYERLSVVCKAAQRLTRQYGVTILLVSQISAAAAREDREPRSSDIVGAGTVEQVSDMMLGVYRPSRLKPRTQSEPDELWHRRRTACRLIIAKNKNGATGVVHAKFEGKFFKFSDPEPSDQGEIFAQHDIPV